MIKIIVDLNGADKPENELALGAILALRKMDDLKVNLCGHKDIILDAIKNLEYDASRLEITDCQDVITNYDIPTKVFKTKPESSLVKGLTLCSQDPEASGFVSCGATGSVLVSSMFILGRIGQIRPALCCKLIGANGPFCLCDCGANTECKPEMIVDFAKMGVAYMKACGVSNPRVGLLSNGAEAKKGTEVIKEAHLLLEASNLNFVGNVEGTSVLENKVDVLASDGFSGNIVLKTIEGTAKTIMHSIEEKKNSSENSQILDSIVKELQNTYDYNSLGGAVLLGVNKPVVKGHGAADSQTVCAIIQEAYVLAKGKVVENIKELLKNDSNLEN